MIGCSEAEFISWIERWFTGHMEWSNYGIQGWHFDHVVPCSSFDLSRKDHQMLCCNWRNLRPMWASENTARCNRWTPQDLEWLCPDYLVQVRAAGVDV